VTKPLHIIKFLSKLQLNKIVIMLRVITYSIVPMRLWLCLRLLGAVMCVISKKCHLVLVTFVILYWKNHVIGKLKSEQILRDADE